MVLRPALRILGIPIHDVTLNETLDRVAAWMTEGGAHQIATVNPEFVMAARRDPAFRAVLGNADLCLPDGVGITLAARYLGRPLRERVAGVDLVERLAARAAEEGWRLFLLGAAPGVAERAAEVLRSRNPGLIVARMSGYGQSGPYADRAGFGGIGEAMGGWRYLVGDPDRPPSRMGVSIGDTLTGTYGCMGVLAALHEAKFEADLEEEGTPVMVNAVDSYIARLGDLEDLLSEHARQYAQVTDKDTRILDWFRNKLNVINHKRLNLFCLINLIRSKVIFKKFRNSIESLLHDKINHFIILVHRVCINSIIH